MNNSIRNMNLTVSDHLQRVVRYALFCVLGLFIPGLAGAVGWEIDPVRIELSPVQPTAAITLRNASEQPTSIQIQAVAWSQLDGKDVYTPTRELLVSPPIVTIAAKGEQVVRVALRRLADATNELTYRINLQELPPQPLPGFAGVQVALRVGLPVFVQPQQGTAVPDMAWKVWRMPDNQFRVRVLNQGNAHVQISDFALYTPGNDQLITGESGSSYVLAGQTHEWILKKNSTGKLTGNRLHLKAFTDADKVDRELVIETQ